MKQKHLRQHMNNQWHRWLNSWQKANPKHTDGDDELTYFGCYCYSPKPQNRAPYPFYAPEAQGINDPFESDGYPRTSFSLIEFFNRYLSFSRNNQKLYQDRYLFRQYRATLLKVWRPEPIELDECHNVLQALDNLISWRKQKYMKVSFDDELIQRVTEALYLRCLISEDIDHKTQRDLRNRFYSIATAEYRDVIDQWISDTNKLDQKQEQWLVFQANILNQLTDKVTKGSPQYMAIYLTDSSNLCPITMRPFIGPFEQDPLIDRQHITLELLNQNIALTPYGTCYALEALNRWLSQSSEEPITRQALNKNELKSWKAQSNVDMELLKNLINLYSIIRDETELSHLMDIELDKTLVTEFVDRLLTNKDDKLTTSIINEHLQQHLLNCTIVCYNTAPKS